MAKNPTQTTPINTTPRVSPTPRAETPTNSAVNTSSASKTGQSALNAGTPPKSGVQNTETQTKQASSQLNLNNLARNAHVDTGNTGNSSENNPSNPNSDNLNITQGNGGNEQNVEIRQENYVDADQQKFLEIMEKYKDDPEKQLEELKKLPQSDEVKKATEDLEKSLNERGTVDNDQKLSKSHGKEDDEFKPFQEEDILKYMYEKWLLGGLNAICNWTYDRAEDLTRKLTDGIVCGSSKAWHNVKAGFKEGRNSSGAAGGTPTPQPEQEQPQPNQPNPQPTPQQGAQSEQEQPNQNPQPNPMQQCIDSNSQMAGEFTNKQVDSISKQGEETSAFLKRVQEGKETEEDKKHPLHANFQKMPEEIRRKRAKEAAKDCEQTHAVTKSVIALSASIVHLKHNQKALGRENPEPMNRVAYQREVALMAMVIGDTLSQTKESGRPKLLETLAKNVQEGQKNVGKDVEKGNYVANGKTPSKNPYLTDLYKQLGLPENGTYGQRINEILSKNTADMSNEERVLNATSLVGATKEDILHKMELRHTKEVEKGIRRPQEQTTGKQTLPEALRDSQEKDKEIKTVVNGVEAQINQTEITANDNDNRRKNLGERVANMSNISSRNAQLLAASLARRGLNVNPQDKSVENVSPLRPKEQQPISKYPARFGYNPKGPDR